MLEQWRVSWGRSWGRDVQALAKKNWKDALLICHVPANLTRDIQRKWSETLRTCQHFSTRIWLHHNRSKLHKMVLQLFHIVKRSVKNRFTTCCIYRRWVSTTTIYPHKKRWIFQIFKACLSYKLYPYLTCTSKPSALLTLSSTTVLMCHHIPDDLQYHYFIQIGEAF